MDRFRLTAVLASATFYFGVAILACGVVLIIRPIARLRVRTRWRAGAIALAGVVTALTAR